MVELLGEYGSTPCLYFAHDAHTGGFKVSDASRGVQMRYSGESGVTALQMVLTQTSLSAASKGGRPDTGGLRSFAREALETLFTVAIGGGLGPWPGQGVVDVWLGSDARGQARPNFGILQARVGGSDAGAAQGVLQLARVGGSDAGAAQGDLQARVGGSDAGAAQGDLQARDGGSDAGAAARAQGTAIETAQGTARGSEHTSAAQAAETERARGWGQPELHSLQHYVPNPTGVQTPPMESPPILRAWLPSQWSR